MKKIKILSLVMAILMLASVAFACTSSDDGEKDNDNKTTPAATTSAPGRTEPEGPGTTPTTPAKDVGEVSWQVSTPFTGSLNLTEYGDIYWEHYGDNADHKAGAEAVFVTGGLGQNHDDNKACLVWTDGENQTVMEVEDPDDIRDPSRHGMNGTSIDITIQTEGIKTITLFVGAWNATNTISFTSDDNDEYEQVTEAILECGDSAQIAIVTIDLSNFKGSTLTIWIDKTAGTGNVSLSGVAASSQVMNPPAADEE